MMQHQSSVTTISTLHIWKCTTVSALDWIEVKQNITHSKSLKGMLATFNEQKYKLLRVNLFSCLVP